MIPLERNRELATIEEAVRAVHEGRGSVVLVEGPAGIGKSAVLDEARRRVGDDLRQLGARAGRLEREFGFGVARQLLEPSARSREVPDAARAVLTDLDGSERDPSGEGGFAVLHGLLWVVLDLAEERPLLLAVDDLQWADRPSLRFLAYLARRVEELPVLLLATIRTGEPDADEDLLDAVRQVATESLLPDPLSPEAVASIVAERLGEQPEDAFVDACHTATRGNPLLVRELVAGLEHDGVRPIARQAEVVRSIGPRAVSRTVAVRLGRLEPSALATAKAVAILGDGVTVTDAARFAGLDEQSVAAATGPLARAEILRSEPPLAFVHPLVADAVVMTLAPGERELQHGRAARFLFEAGASPEQIAGHLVRAPAVGEAWAVGVLRDAARTAMQRGAPESASVFLRRALDEPAAESRAELLLELGLAEALSNGHGAVEHLRDALAALVDPPQRALAAAALGRTLLFTGHPQAAADVAREVAAEMGEAHADLRDQLLGFAHMTAWFDERAVGAVEATRELRDRVPPPGATAGPRLLAAPTSYAWAAEPGPRDACAELASAALAEGWLLEADPGFLFLPPVLVLAYAERPEAIAHLEEGLAYAHRRGSLFAIGGIRLWLAAVRMWRSELEEAEAIARQAREDLQLWGFDVDALGHQGFLLGTLVQRGRLGEAREVLEAIGDPSPPLETVRHFQQAKLELLIAEGRDEEALAAARVLETAYGHVRNPATADWRSLRAPLRHRAGDVEGALDDLAEELDLARAWGAPGPIGRALRVRGELRGDAEELREAVALLAGSTMRLEHARALLALGRRIRLDGSPTEAREPLREALAVAVACGADGLAADVRAELGAAGARPRTDALSGPEALTPSERRIAELAAGGLTNRDIAQQLFVTPKTVEVHLSSVYRKLGIASRRGLPQAMAA